MVDLTVGYVSGFVALCVFFLQLVSPNVITLLIAACLDRGATAVTWSVAGRELQGSLWPTILQSDTAESSKAPWKIKTLVWIRLAAVALIAVAAVITPLGLHDAMITSTATEVQALKYVPDDGPMGYGTPPRSDLAFTRICSVKPYDDLDFGFLPASCPGVDFVAEYGRNGTEVSVSWDGTYDVRIPRAKAVHLQSGLDEQPASVSSFFDIDWRQHSFRSEGGYNNNESFPVGTYRPLASLLLTGGTQVVEGLIVDFVNGAVGLRNHTAPTEVRTGARWQEDLLFVEPTTACVDTNLTLDYQLPESSVLPHLRNLALTDRGGFSKINTTYPGVLMADTQRDPQLYFRAYKGAVLSAMYIMSYLNVSEPGNGLRESHIGKRFPFESDAITVALDSSSIVSLSLGSLGFYLGVESIEVEEALGNKTSFGDIETLCVGAGGADEANIHTIGVVCGALLGAPERQDGNSPLFFEPGSSWMRRLYVCASAPHASIKTVQFGWNSSRAGLGRLEVGNIEEKLYGSDSEKPWWAVEDPKMSWAEIGNLLWGLVSVSNARGDTSGQYQYVQSHRLVLPGLSGLPMGGSSLSTSTSAAMNLPGADFAANALAGTYGVDAGSLYSGQLSLALFRKWQGMTRSASEAAKVIDLVWTDIAANAVVGTRGWLPSPRLPPNLQDDPPARPHSKRGLAQSERQGHSVSNTRVSIPVHIIRRRVAFDWRYGIPGLIVLLLFAAILGAMVFATIYGRLHLDRLRWYLNNLSAGRLLTKHLQTQEGEAATLSTKQWTRSYGTLEVDLGPIVKENRAGYVHPVYSPTKPEEANGCSRPETNSDSAGSESVSRGDAESS